MKSRVSGTFYLSAALGGTVGMLGALMISGLSAFAMRRLGVEMQWLQVAASGAAGGIIGNFLLRLIMRLIRRLGFANRGLDRFAAYFVAGFSLSIVLGMAVLFAVFRGSHGAVGPKLFTVIGWMVGILASSFPLAIVELSSASSFSRDGRV